MADKLTTILCQMPRNLRASTTWNPHVLSRPVQGVLYLYLYCKYYKFQHLNFYSLPTEHFVCCVQISEQTAIISLHNIN